MPRGQRFLVLGLSLLAASASLASAQNRARAPSDSVAEDDIVGPITPLRVEDVGPSVVSFQTRARAARDRGQGARALRHFRQAMDAAPTVADTVLAYGWALLPHELPTAPPSTQTRERAASIRARVQTALGPPAVQNAENALRLRRLDAWAMAVVGDTAGAVDLLTRACGRLDERSSHLLQRLATFAIEHHTLQLADSALEGARLCDSASVAPLWELAVLRLARGRPSEAVTLMREVVQRQPGDADALLDLAGALLAAGEAASAVRLYTDLTNRCDDHVRCELNLARAALEARAFDVGIAAAERARSHSAEHDPEASLVLGSIYVARGTPRDAEAAFRDALQRAPGNPRASEALRALQSDARTGSPPNSE